jgi:hypothetical protein
MEADRKSFLHCKGGGGEYEKASVNGAGFVFYGGLIHVEYHRC